MKTEHSCRLCGSKTVEVTYDGHMRHSGISTEYSDKHRILRCGSCLVEFIDPFQEEGSEVYQDGSYWDRKGAGSVTDIERLHKKALAENLLWLDKIGASKLAGKRLLDFGCGSGAFLDLVKGLGMATVGIERDPGLAAFAEERGHQVFGSLDEVYAAGVQVDAVVSFDVFEHLREPLAVMESIKKVLVNEGYLYVGVPNQLDMIKSLVPAYLPHFYHVEHLWYFDEHSLSQLLEQAEYQVSTLHYLHKYNFMNIIEWARTGKAPGNPHCDAVDSDLDERLRGWLEDRGVASHLLLEATYTR